MAYTPEQWAKLVEDAIDKLKDYDNTYSMYYAYYIDSREAIELLAKFFEEAEKELNGIQA